MLKKIEKVRKFVVALVAAGAGVYGVIEKADLSTKEGVYAALMGIGAAAAVWIVPNKA